MTPDGENARGMPGGMKNTILRIIFGPLFAMNMDSCFRRNDEKRPELPSVLQQLVTPDPAPGSMSEC
jgi:hypothetical protein